MIHLYSIYDKDSKALFFTPCRLSIASRTDLGYVYFFLFQVNLKAIERLFRI